MADARLYAALCPEGQEHEAAWALLRWALARDWELPALPPVALGEHGKPGFPDHPRLCFNLSHSHGAVVCALASTPVGVDVEKLRTPPARLARGRSPEAFFRRWTGQEAALKREGLSAGALLHHDPEPDPLCQWFPRLLPGYAVCLCPTEALRVLEERVVL